MNVIKSINEVETVGQIAPDSIVNADCLEAMKFIPDNSIDLICTDPPYFKVKKEQWDRQWDTAKGFLEWLDLIAEQWQRILKPNGSLYCFASPKMAARVEVMLGERFNILTHIIWQKDVETFAGDSRMAYLKLVRKESLRQFNTSTERIIFCEHYGADNIAKGEAGYGAKCDELRGFIFEPLRAYLDGERMKAGAKLSLLNEMFGFSTTGSGWARDTFTRLDGGWNMITKENYLKLQKAFPNYFTREYEDLRREYEDLRRPFNVTADVLYTDVWTYPTVSYYEGKHPCEKPIAMLEHIITASSHEGALVLDSFAGSANTAIAAINTNRQYICIEKDPHYFEVMRNRIENHDPNAPVKVKKPKAAPKGQLSLFTT